MKKLLLILSLAAFTAGVTLQAQDNSPAKKSGQSEDAKKVAKKGEKKEKKAEKKGEKKARKGDKKEDDKPKQ